MKFKNRMNPKYTQISGYVIVTCIIIFCLSRIADNLGVIFKSIGIGLSWINAILRPMIYGFAIAYLLAPAVDFFEKQLEKTKHYQKHGKKTRPAAVLIVMLIALAGIILLFSVIISTFTHQLTVASFDDILGMVDSYAKTLTNFYNTVSRRLSSLNIESSSLQKYFEEAGTYIAGIFSGMGKGLMKSVANLKTFLTNSIFAIIFAVYFMLDGKMLMKYWNRVLKAFTSEKADRRFHEFVKDADMVFSGYVRGQLIDALLMAVMISISLSLIGVKFAVVIGIFTGIGNLIPYIGPIVAYVSTILVCLINGDYKKIIIAVIVLFIVQTLDGNFINPKLLSSNIHIHPLLVIMSLIVGSAVGGVMGMLLAVPVGALVKILFDKAVDEILRTRKLESEEQSGVTEEEIEADEQANE